MSTEVARCCFAPIPAIPYVTNPLMTIHGRFVKIWAENLPASCPDRCLRVIERILMVAPAILANILLLVISLGACCCCNVKVVEEVPPLSRQERINNWIKEKLALCQKHVIPSTPDAVIWARIEVTSAKKVVWSVEESVVRPKDNHAQAVTELSQKILSQPIQMEVASPFVASIKHFIVIKSGENEYNLMTTEYESDGFDSHSPLGNKVDLSNMKAHLKKYENHEPLELYWEKIPNMTKAIAS
jgi:hypothetical protein